MGRRRAKLSRAENRSWRARGAQRVLVWLGRADAWHKSDCYLDSTRQDSTGQSRVRGDAAACAMQGEAQPRRGRGGRGGRAACWSVGILRRPILSWAA